MVHIQLNREQNNNTDCDLQNYIGYKRATTISRQVMQPRRLQLDSLYTNGSEGTLTTTA